jgi:hypothetical protein
MQLLTDPSNLLDEMPHSYDLTKLDERSFEHLANFLALRTLGAGHTGFGPGPDGGRDGYFEGEAPYPSVTERWSGVWYLQSKYHRPHLSADPQAWLLDQIKKELEQFSRPDSRRSWPDNWIFVTNIEPSGALQTGAFDRARALVANVNPALALRFHIWGGSKVLQLLALNPEIAEYYYHFLTPGHVLTQLYRQLEDSSASIKSIVRYFVVTQFTEQQYTKLDQAGSAADTRPGIHRLFTDIPFRCAAAKLEGMGIDYLTRASAQNHRHDSRISDLPTWRDWYNYPSRSRVWFVKGGPGQGKSTLTQYLSQIQRAALILDGSGPQVTAQQREVAKEIEAVAGKTDLWPTAPRIPVYLELKDFAKWFGEKKRKNPRGVMSFLAERLSQRLEQPVQTGTLRRAFAEGRWLFVFDGLDEVPSDVKDQLAHEVTIFIDDHLVELGSDAFFVCTSRPQGYSGQFSNLESSEIVLIPLNPEQALVCAAPVLEIDRDKTESDRNLETLKEAIQSASVREIMTTPLQAHIMAVVVRDGGRPPDRKWRLFANFYQVIKKREANRNLPDKRISTLLRAGDKLIKSLHNRLGFELQARAEISAGAQTSIERNDLSKIIRETVSDLQSTNVEGAIETLLEATTVRLVLVNTPESGSHVRFDIRPLQEFFAAEFIYEDIPAAHLGDRIALIAPDSHWKEVIHFTLSALVENSRSTDLAVAVDKLTYLNEPVEGSPARLFYRRLAAGAAVAARLLAEGVLEQDKRVRQQFKRCLEPLFGSTEIELNSVLGSVTGVDTTSWLIDVLADTLSEQSENESIGAAFISCLLVPDDHKRLPEIEASIRKKSVDFRGCLFEMLRIHSRGNNEEIENIARLRWVGKLAFHCLSSADWHRLNAEGITAMFEIASSFGENIPQIAGSAGLEYSLANFLVPLLGDAPHSHNSKEEYSENWSNIVNVTFFQFEDRLDADKWTDELRSALIRAPGVFSLIGPTFAVASGDRTAASLTPLISASSILKSLPECWQAFLPLQFTDASYEHTGADNLSQKALTLSWLAKPGYTWEAEIPEEFAESDFGDLLQNHPGLALSLLLFASDKPGRASWNFLIQYCLTSAGSAKLETACVENPSAVATVPHLWGRLLDLCKGSEGIKAAIRAAAPKWTASNQPIGELYTFALQLPEEIELLPAVIHIAVGPRFTFEGEPHLSSPEIVARYVPEVDSLLRIFGASQPFAPEVKGAAAIMCLLHPDLPSVHSSECIQAIVHNYRPHAKRWYLCAAATSLEGLIGQGNTLAIEALGSLLLAITTDLSARLELNDIFDNFRQKSKAPVNQHGINRF